MPLRPSKMYENYVHDKMTFLQSIKYTELFKTSFRKLLHAYRCWA